MKKLRWVSIQNLVKISCQQQSEYKFYLICLFQSRWAYRSAFFSISEAFLNEDFSMPGICLFIFLFTFKAIYDIRKVRSIHGLAFPHFQKSAGNSLDEDLQILNSNYRLVYFTLISAAERFTIKMLHFPLLFIFHLINTGK